MNDMNDSANYRNNKALAEVKILSGIDTVYGLPRKIFIFTIGMGVIGIYAMHWFIGLIFAGAVMGVMFSIHADDPRAVDVWLRAFRRADRWSAGLCRKREVVFLNEKE